MTLLNRILIPVDVISTHTLTWSMTRYVLAHSDRAVISTHTLTWSMTFLLLVEHIICDISTHTLTWSMTTVIETVAENIGISTHTLTWSMTILAQHLHQSEIHFNSHAHVEHDLNEISNEMIGEFQLTRSRGA